MHPSDPPIACTESRVHAVMFLCNDLLTSQQATTVTVLIADLVRERDAGLAAFMNLVLAGEHLRAVLDADNPPENVDIAAIQRFEELLADARKVGPT